MRGFTSTHPKPPSCRDYKADYIVPLSLGGSGVSSNMRWLPRQQRLDKTRRELGP
jgi:hypothetical protein